MSVRFHIYTACTDWYYTSLKKLQELRRPLFLPARAQTTESSWCCFWSIEAPRILILRPGSSPLLLVHLPLQLLLGAVEIDSSYAPSRAYMSHTLRPNPELVDWTLSLLEAPSYTRTSDSRCSTLGDASVYSECTIVSQLGRFHSVSDMSTCRSNQTSLGVCCSMEACSRHARFLRLRVGELLLRSKGAWGQDDRIDSRSAVPYQWTAHQGTHKREHIRPKLEPSHL